MHKGNTKNTHNKTHLVAHVILCDYINYKKIINMAISAERSSCLIKVLTLLTGAAMMLLGILRFVFVTDIKILDGIWTVYWMYYKKNNLKRIFGLVLILVELKIQFIVNYVEFLVDYCGKGMFIIL